MRGVSWWCSSCKECCSEAVELVEKRTGTRSAGFRLIQKEWRKKRKRDEGNEGRREFEGSESRRCWAGRQQSWLVQVK
jgi:hypothetical protein